MRLAKHLLGASTMENAHALKESFVRGRALCAYTARELSFRTARGVHVDPAGPRAVENVEWVHADVAAAKGAMTRATFLALAAEVAGRSATAASPTRA